MALHALDDTRYDSLNTINSYKMVHLDGIEPPTRKSSAYRSTDELQIQKERLSRIERDFSFRDFKTQGNPKTRFTPDKLTAMKFGNGGEIRTHDMQLMRLPPKPTRLPR